jgi:hypothetical protein
MIETYAKVNDIRLTKQAAFCTLLGHSHVLLRLRLRVAEISLSSFHRREIALFVILRELNGQAVGARAG